MRKLVRLLIATISALALAPAAAQAASLVYVDGDRDVAVARPDGSLAHKVTHATDSEHGYKAISVADDDRCGSRPDASRDRRVPARRHDIRQGEQ